VGLGEGGTRGGAERIARGSDRGTSAFIVGGTEKKVSERKMSKARA